MHSVLLFLLQVQEVSIGISKYTLIGAPISISSNTSGQNEPAVAIMALAGILDFSLGEIYVLKFES